MRRLFITLTNSDGTKVWFNVDNILYIKEKDPTIDANSYNAVVMTVPAAVFVKEDYNTIKKMLLDAKS